LSEAIPIDSNSSRDGFRQELNPSYGLQWSKAGAAREQAAPSKAERRAKAKGYEGEMCGECGNFTLARNGTCMKCDTCGSTTGCS
jgi:ribonucleoside-diphosphate reductase alpha chain